MSTTMGDGSHTGDHSHLTVDSIPPASALQLGFELINSPPCPKGWDSVVLEEQQCGAVKGERDRGRDRPRLCTTGRQVLFVFLTLATFAAVAVVHTPLGLDPYQNKTLFTQDPTKHAGAVSLLAFVPLAVVGTCLGFQFIMINSSFFETSQYQWVPTKPALALVTAAVYQLVRRALILMLAEPDADKWLLGILDILFYIFCYCAWCMFLSQVSIWVDMLVAQEAVIYQAKPIAKGLRILNGKGVARSDNPAKDAVHAFDSLTILEGYPSKRLRLVWSMYALVGYGVGFVATFLACLDFHKVSLSAIVGFVVVTATAMILGAIQMAPSLLALIDIVFHRPFFVGDIIEVAGLGNGETVNECTGFVEAVSLTGLVIRNFSMKQTWVPFSAYNGKVVQNWSRRATKTINLEFSVPESVAVEVVVELANWGRTWIKQCPRVLRSGYMKCVIIKAEIGPLIQVIFFPDVGVSHKKLREEFLVAFLGESARLGIAKDSIRFCGSAL